MQKGWHTRLSFMFCLPVCLHVCALCTSLSLSLCAFICSHDVTGEVLVQRILSEVSQLKNNRPTDQPVATLDEWLDALGLGFYWPHFVFFDFKPEDIKNKEIMDLLNEKRLKEVCVWCMVRGMCGMCVCVWCVVCGMCGICVRCVVSVRLCLCVCMSVCLLPLARSQQAASSLQIRVLFSALPASPDGHCQAGAPPPAHSGAQGCPEATARRERPPAVYVIHAP